MQGYVFFSYDYSDLCNQILQRAHIFTAAIRNEHKILAVSFVDKL